MLNKLHKLAGASLLGTAITVHAIIHPHEGHSHSEVDHEKPLTTLVIPFTGNQQTDSRIVFLHDLTFTQSGVQTPSGQGVEYPAIATSVDGEVRTCDDRGGSGTEIPHAFRLA